MYLRRMFDGEEMDGENDIEYSADRERGMVEVADEFDAF